MTNSELRALRSAAGGPGGWQPEKTSEWVIARTLRERGLLRGPTASSRYAPTDRGYEVLHRGIRDGVVEAL